MSSLAEQLRVYVDSVSPVALSEVTTRPRRWHRPVLVLVAAATCIGLAIAGLAATRTTGSNRQVRTTTVPTSFDPCTTAPGCPVDRTVASARLGFAVRLPTYVPAGWVKTSYANLRVYPPHSQPNGSPQHTVLVYGVIWAPPGTDLYAGCPDQLSIRQRRVDFDRLGPGAVDLGNGRLVEGSVYSATCGTGGGTATFATFHWIDRGVYFTLNATGLARDEVVAVLRSFND
jgi:hypothetical protein